MYVKKYYNMNEQTQHCYYDTQHETQVTKPQNKKNRLNKEDPKVFF